MRLLSPEFLWLVGTTEVYSGPGADIVMESISLNKESMIQQTGYDNPLAGFIVAGYESGSTAVPRYFGD